MELEDLKKRLEQEHIIAWVKDAVIKSITPQQVILCFLCYRITTPIISYLEIVRWLYYKQLRVNICGEAYENICLPQNTTHINIYTL